MSPVELDQLLESLDSSRRTFLKSLILGTAYATPMVTSFGMEGAGLGEEALGGLSSNIAGLCSNISSEDPNFFSNADVVVNKTVFPEPASPGEQLTFTLEVFNCGPAEAVGVVLTDQLPAGTTFVSSAQTGGSVSFNISEPSVGSNGALWQATALAPIPVGETVYFSIVVEVAP